MYGYPWCAYPTVFSKKIQHTYPVFLEELRSQGWCIFSRNEELKNGRQHMNIMKFEICFFFEIHGFRNSTRQWPNRTTRSGVSFYWENRRYQTVDETDSQLTLNEVGKSTGGASTFWGEEKRPCQLIQSDLFIIFYLPFGGHLNHLKGHLTKPKRSQRIARWIFFVKREPSLKLTARPWNGRKMYSLLK